MILYYLFVESAILTSVNIVRYGGVAHRLEQDAHNVLVDGSTPSTPTINLIYSGVLFFTGGFENIAPPSELFEEFFDVAMDILGLEVSFVIKR